MFEALILEEEKFAFVKDEKFKADSWKDANNVICISRQNSGYGIPPNPRKRKWQWSCPPTIAPYIESKIILEITQKLDNDISAMEGYCTWLNSYIQKVSFKTRKEALNDALNILQPKLTETKISSKLKLMTKNSYSLNCNGKALPFVIVKEETLNLWTQHSYTLQGCAQLTKFQITKQDHIKYFREILADNLDKIYYVSNNIFPYKQINENKVTPLCWWWLPAIKSEVELSQIFSP